MSTNVVDREQIDARYRWNAESVYQGWDEWEDDFERLRAEVDLLGASRGTLGAGPDELHEWLEKVQDFQTRLFKLIVYANMTYSCDARDEQASAYRQRAMGLAALAAAATAFAEPEIMEIGFEELRSWIERDSRLQVYRHYFDKLESRAEHVRSEEVEEVLGGLNDPFGSATQIHGVLANTDLTFDKAVDAQGDAHEITQATIRALLGSDDRKLRESAWSNYADAHLAYRHTMAATLTTGIKQNVFMSRVRRYASALDMAMKPEKIPSDVFFNLIETFKEHLPVWHRYWEVRRRALGVDRLYEYDVFAPLTTTKIEISYEQAVDWISEAMTPLGQDYVQMMRRGALEERWVDVYPNRGKRMGAFSAGVSKATYPFIMMSYTDDLQSMSTLAHELGHSMHSQLSWRKQPPLYRYGMFVAEVASNFNQALTRAHLFGLDKGRDFDIALIEEAMANFHRYFFIMPTLARFEYEIHRRIESGQALSADGMQGLMADLFREGYGDALVMDTGRTGITWAQFHTHLYSRFYVYQYATGISAAHALAERVLQDPAAAHDYLAFLEAGGSKYPLDALNDAGVDLATPKPIEETFSVLSDLVDRLEVLTS